MSVAAKTREDTASMTREYEFLGGNRGDLCVKEFRSDSTPTVRDKTRVDTRDKRIKTTRDCGGRKQRSPSGQLVSASFPGRNECPGTHCSLIEQEEREDSSCQICHRV